MKIALWTIMSATTILGKNNYSLINFLFNKHIFYEAFKVFNHGCTSHAACQLQ